MLQSNDTVDLFKDEFLEFKPQVITRRRCCCCCCRAGPRRSRERAVAVYVRARLLLPAAACCCCCLQGQNDGDSRSEQNIKELHSFTDLVFSKNRIISAIAWHPARTGVVAFACANNLTFDQVCVRAPVCMRASVCVSRVRVRVGGNDATCARHSPVVADQLT